MLSIFIRSKPYHLSLLPNTNHMSNNHPNPNQLHYHPSNNYNNRQQPEEGEVVSEDEETSSRYDSSHQSMQKRQTRKEQRRRQKDRKDDRKKKDKHKDKNHRKARDRSQEKQDRNYKNRQNSNYANRDEKHDRNREDDSRRRQDRKDRNKKHKDDQQSESPTKQTDLSIPVDRKNVIYTYKIENKSKLRHVSEAHLQQRIKTALQQLQKNLDALKSPPPNTPSSTPQQDEPLDHQFHQRHRYFDVLEEGINRVKCYRCGARGHLSHNCLQPRIDSCVYCLRGHRSGDCQQTCFRCGLQGHISNDCKIQGRSCSICSKYGHEKINCGSVLLSGKRTEPEDYFSPEEMQFQADINALRCLKHCDMEGHYNCHKYGPEAHSYIYDYNK